MPLFVGPCDDEVRIRVPFDDAPEGRSQQVESLDRMDTSQEQDDRRRRGYMKTFAHRTAIAVCFGKQLDSIGRIHSAAGFGDAVELIELGPRGCVESRRLANHATIGERIHQLLAPPVVREGRGSKHAAR